ncbi:MAG: hypothetical protein ACF8QF_03315 [Phycisphaerales bacterium]
MSAIRSARFALLVVIGVLACASGCARSALRLSSSQTDATLTPRFVTALYAFTDENTLDIVLSDMPADDLLAMSRDDLLRSSGSILHIHQFFTPVAGRTALDPTASNTTVRHVVLARGEIGVYGGGGLVLPGSSPGANRFDFRVSDATMRLLQATPGFADLLGGASLSGRASARRDDERAASIARLVHQAVTLTEQIGP